MFFVTQLRSLGASLLAAVCACTMLLTAAGVQAADLPQFLVVDYHPLSKTLAPGGTPAHPLYDYVYRVDVRNAGAAAANVSGAVRSRLPSITVPDAGADFGTVGAHQTKASTDTITLRANQFFDRRLDRKVSVNGKSQYQVAGNDEDDSQIPGLPLLPGLSDELLGWFYDIKFQFLFQWTFTVRDNSAPAITKLLPQQGQTDGKPSISASYQDEAGGSGVNTASVKLSVDGVDVSAQAKISSTGISYKPAKALAEGSHTVVLTVADKSGNKGSASWSFVVDTLAPKVTAEAPKDLRNASPSAVISASYGDQGGSGIDTAKVTLSVDRVDVTAAAVVGPAGIRYTPPRKLSDGTHRVALKVVDAVGNSSTDEWSFGVDSRGVTITQQAPADGAVLAADGVPRIGAALVSVGTVIVPAKTVLTLDGKNVTAQATISTGGIAYTPPAALAEGLHTVTLSVTDKLGYVAESSWHFITRSAPEITAVAPQDVVLNAQASVAISARYRDTGAGIDTAAVVLRLDGIDVTAQAQVGATGLTLTPATALEQGVHVLTLTVGDKAGNSSTTTWRFTLDSGLPVISQQLPKDALVASATPRISAAYQDTGERGTGIDTAKVRLAIDGVDVTAHAQVGATGISYTPSQALAGGLRTVTLSLADQAGNAVGSVWSFTIDADGPVIAGSVAPEQGALLAADVLPVISAQYQDAGGGVDAGRVVLEIDGQAVTAQAAVSDTGIRYQPTQPLAEGDHTVVLTVQDRAGNSSQRNWSFKTATAPQILTFGPSAVILPGQAQPNIFASYSDVGSGVDPASVRLLFDGADVTAQAQAGADKIEYAAPRPLVDGDHAVLLTLADRSGNIAQQQWAFAVKTVNTAPPLISQQSPSEVYLPSGATPVIGASYAATGPAIDTARVRLLLDGVDVSAKAVVSATAIRYTVPAPLADGNHTVSLTVPDVAGNAAMSSWRFGTASTPEIIAVTPKDVALPSGSKPVLSAKFLSASASIDAASVLMVVDGVDVTAKATVSAGGVSFTPAQALAEGNHNVYVTVSTRSGAAAEAFWGFDIAPLTTYDVAIVSPASGAVSGLGRLQVTATATSSASYAQALSANGVEMAPVAGGGFGATVELADGSNTVTVTATYADGTVRSASTVVTYDAPPVVTIRGPTDKATLGPVNPNSPRDLSGNVERPVTITGTVSKPVAGVTVNQQAAQLDAGGTSFSFPNFFLHEGINLLNAVATDAGGRTATASVTVTVDQTAPLLSVEAPLKDAITSNARIDVRGVVNDAVEGWADVPYPQVTVSNAANQQVRSAKVSDRFYIAEDIPLEVGANVLRIAAIDHVGNARQQDITVTRIAAGSDRLTMLGGNRQRGALNSPLAKPLAVVALARDGNPLANTALTFDVLRGTGSIAATAGGAGQAGAPVRNLVVRTDQAGRAQVWLTLGKQSGEAGNMVRASHPAIGEDVVFTATGDKGAPAFIRADSGATQFGETGASALEPLSAVVTDSEENRVPDIAVVFSVEQGSAGFVDANGTLSASYTARTDNNGMATARPLYGAEPGLVRINARALDPARQTEIQGASYQLQVLRQQDGPTRFSGKVLSHSGQPLPGVRVSIGRTSLSATADDSGYFTFPGQVPPGKLDLFIDGRTANVQTSQYPALHFEALAVRGQDNVLPHAIYLPPLLMSEAKIVGGNQDVTLKIPGFEGFEMVVKANSVTFPDGSRSGPLVVSPVQQDKLPMVPPGGYNGFMSPAWTIQPSGTRFDPPLQVKVPNSLGLKPGETRAIYQWDHDLATFVPMGRATVSEDGAQLVSDANSGVTKAGWGGPPNPPPDPPKCGVSKCSACQKRNPAGQAPCCMADPAKDGYVRSSTNTKLELQSVVPIGKLGRAVGVEFSLSTKGEVSAAGDDSCCAKKGEQGAMKYSLSGNLVAEFEAAVPLLPILRLIPVGDFIPGGNAVIPQAKFKLSLSAGGSGEYDGCSEAGQASGKLTGGLEVDLLSLSDEWELKYKRKGPYGGQMVTDTQKITLLEIGATGQASGSLQEWPKNGLVGEYGYSIAVFVRLPQISVGSFNITLGEFSVPLLQKVPPGKFNCPMVNGKLTGDCKTQD
jgi:hypothetical protein